ncbi:MAG TPA: GAF domain-containing protein, partial [Acidobacteriota bacterium]|nr:GAF domain-containing protein [Acidobacteriota bacterium]
QMAAPDEPMETDPFAEERNLYQRIINNYRNAVSQVNSLLEEHVAFLSGFYRMIENIKETDNFQNICAQIADCVLQDFRAEYCSLRFLNGKSSDSSPVSLEGVRENRKFVRFHSSPSILGSEEFEAVLGQMTLESAGCLTIGDVYREPQFNRVDFPSVIRSLVCLPIILHNNPVGMLVLGHSRAQYFNENHIRVLKILASTIAHLHLLTTRQNGDSPASNPRPLEPPPVEENDFFSIVVLDFEDRDSYGRVTHLEKETINSIRRKLVKAFRGIGTVLFRDDDELLVIFVGVSTELLLDRIAVIRSTFHEWKEEQGERMQGICMNLGYSMSEGDDDLSRTLEVASLVKRPALEEDPGPPAVN